RLDHGDVHAVRTPQAGELDADHPTAEHHHAGRQRRHPQGVLTGDDAVAVDLDPGEGAWFRSGRQDDVTGGQDGVVHLDADPRLGRDQPATAGHHLDAAGGDQPSEPLVQSVDDPVRVVPYPGRIDVVQVGVHP